MATRRKKTQRKRAPERPKSRVASDQGARVAIYARVSTTGQKSLPAQVEACENYATRRGWTVVRTVEEKKSGATERPAREELMNAARRREIDHVLVWKLDRWGRSTVDLLKTLQELKDIGVGFVSLTETIDMDTAMGRMLASMLSLFAQFERELAAERIRLGQAHARANGVHVGRPPIDGARVRSMAKNGAPNKAIAATLGISERSVRRALAAGAPR